jgi:lysyl-tRNA synthetase class 2
MENDYRVLRAQIIWAIRQYFYGCGFIECDTPTLVPSPGMEPHIRPMVVAPYGLPQQQSGSHAPVFLPTSPEFAMKKLLAQGYGRIFQICRAYRHEPISTTHNPEFAILEWYRSPGNYEEIMSDVEWLFDYVQTHVAGVLPKQKFLRISVKDAFKQYAHTDLVPMLKALKGKSPLEVEAFNDWFFKIMMDQVEPGLQKQNRPVILYGYPDFQAALANVTEPDTDGLCWAKRFEVYAGGFELANAFDELVDAKEQRRRFEKDMALRKSLYGDDFPPSPTDEELLAALALIPTAGGIALGVDRLVMYLTGATNIKQVLWG